jgi:diguanylate cyclase (GGDEF)-like protein
VFFPIAAVLEGVLIVLFICFIPLLHRTSKRIQAQMEEIEHASRHDDLTGLPNRVGFQELVESALADARGAGPGPAVIVLDVNDFREVNDTLGHGAGDDLLRALGSRVERSLPAAWPLARLGGDEFAVLLPEASDAGVVAAAETVLGTFAEPVVVNDVPLAIEASIGIALSPRHGADPGSLLKHADVAMYEAKQLRSGYVIYDPRSDQNDPERLRLFADFRRALTNRELAVHYQPKAALTGNEIVGVEALVRWHHPERGLVPPDDFLPLAERTGLMKPLTQHVFELAVRDARAWEELGLDLRLSVNLSAADLLDEAVPVELVRIAREAGVDLRNLEVEVTESAAMADPARTRDVLLAFSRVGFSIAIDDFGTGYSSLAYLRSLPVNVLKIDKSFVQRMSQNEDDATIVRSTVELGSNLGLRVIAEGVETAEHWRTLRDYGCHEAQGYLIGAPMPPDELTAWLTGLEPGADQSPGALRAG